MISQNNVKVLRPGKSGQKLKPKEYQKLTAGSCRAVKDIQIGSLIGWEDVEENEHYQRSEKVEISLITDLEKSMPVLWEHDQKMQQLNFPDSYPNKEMFEKRVRQEYAAGAAYFFLYEQKKIIGSLILMAKENPYRHQRYGDIRNIYLEPECRGKGYGKKMLDFADQYFKKNGCSYAFAGIAAYNPASNALFEKAGYNKTRYILEKRY